MSRHAAPCRRRRSAVRSAGDPVSSAIPTRVTIPGRSGRRSPESSAQARTWREAPPCMRCRGLAWPPSQAAADCSAATVPGCRTASPDPEPADVAACWVPDPGSLPDRGSFVAVNEFLQPSGGTAQGLSAKNSKILSEAIRWPRRAGCKSVIDSFIRGRSHHLPGCKLLTA
jgi:hypothetical protein